MTPSFCSRSTRLFIAALALILLALPAAFAGKEDVAAAAAAKRAQLGEEEIQRQLRENIIDDADLLPTQPPAKEYKPTGEAEYALLITPGLGKGCNLKAFPNLMQFLQEDAHYYPNLQVDYMVATDPKLKFYASAEHRASSLVHASDLSTDDLLALLQAGRDESKEPLQHIDLRYDPEPGELRWIMEQHKVARAEQPDEDHSSRHIFQPGFVPIED